MKAAILFLLANAALHGEESGKTVWYDSKGKVVLAEENAAKAPEPFVPQWVAREERRDRALKRGVRQRRSGACNACWGWAYPVYGFRYASPCYHRFFPTGGVRVIIR